MSNVKGICTTDDPVDTLEYHILIAEDDTFDVTVRPSFRPDKALKIDQELYYKVHSEQSLKVCQ